MTDFFADAEAGSSVRGKLNSLWLPRDSGLISSPMPWIDIDIPSDGSEFEFRMSGFNIDAAGNLPNATINFSLNGTNWLGDGSNFDTYYSAAFSDSNINGGRTLADTSERWDSAAYFSLVATPVTAADAIVPFSSVMIIRPGNSSYSPSATWTSSVAKTATAAFTGQWYIEEGFLSLNPVATVVPMLARLKKFRISLYDNVYCGADAAEANLNFVSGEWSLFGRK